jgi:hypothetical protein
MISAAYDWIKCSTDCAAEEQLDRTPLELFTIPYGIPKAWSQSKRKPAKAARISSYDFRKMGLCPQEILLVDYSR